MRVLPLLATAADIAAPALSSSLPTVELDYSTIQAVGGNTTVGYYKYQNIRFAAPQLPPQENETNTGTNLADADVACTSSEDCLYLDVWAPANATNLPVMVWTYGGGFSTGSKSQNTPEGLFDLTQDFIFVAYNYRLGITGLDNGPTYQHEGGAANWWCGILPALSSGSRRTLTSSEAPERRHRCRLLCWWLAGHVPDDALWWQRPAAL